MRFGVHIPAWRRWALLEVALQHLQRVSAELEPLGHELVACVAGSEGEQLGALVAPYADYVAVPNKPLGPKINAAVAQLSIHGVDACIGIGSDDFFTAALVTRWAELLEEGYDYMGVLDGYMYDLRTHRLVHWNGYTNERRGETFGPGRCMSADLLDLVGWKPYGAEHLCMDGSLERTLAAHEIRRWAGIASPVLDVKSEYNRNPLPADGDSMPLPGVWLRETLGGETADALALLREWNVAG